MSSENRGRKRSKAFYRKSAHGGKKQCLGGNRLEPGQRGFLVMCNNNESSAVREAYNILNDYADQLYGQGLSGPKLSDETSNSEMGVDQTTHVDKAEGSCSDEDDDCDDIEKALKKEVESMKSQPSEQRRFQNCNTKAKNCVFIRTTVADPVSLAVAIMEDIAEKKVSRARYAARMLPIVGTCKAHTPDIEQLAQKIFPSIFSPHNQEVPKSFTVLFKVRNNNATTCGKMSVIPAVTKVVKEINPSIEFSWSDFDVAILVEVVCTVCCLGVAPKFSKLRKYNFQELLQGPKDVGEEVVGKEVEEKNVATQGGGKDFEPAQSGSTESQDVEIETGGVQEPTEGVFIDNEQKLGDQNGSLESQPEKLASEDLSQNSENVKVEEETKGDAESETV